MEHRRSHNHTIHRQRAGYTGGGGSDLASNPHITSISSFAGRIPAKIIIDNKTGGGKSIFDLNVVTPTVGNTFGNIQYRKWTDGTTQSSRYINIRHDATGSVLHFGGIAGSVHTFGSATSLQDLIDDDRALY